MALPTKLSYFDGGVTVDQIRQNRAEKGALYEQI